MARLLFVIIMLITSTNIAWAGTIKQYVKSTASQQTKTQTACDKPFNVSSTFQESQGDIVERRGCCSRHNGVCGCSGGRAKCCDGSLSPSCGCD